jgi:hypothetical protein
LKSLWGDSKVCLENALELEKRLVVKHDRREVAGSDTSFGETILHGSRRESIVTFFSGESLFLRCGDDISIAHEAGGAVVVKGGDA